MLIIRIKDLVVEAKHGVHQREKTTTQPFRISVRLTLNSDKASVSDELDDTLNYSAVRTAIIEVAQNNSFNLLERLAREIAERLLQNQRVQDVVVSVDKPAVFDNGVPGVTLKLTR